MDEGILEIDVVEASETVAAMLEPTRLRLLQELADPGSGAELARRLELPRQRVNYHLRELEKAGLVELVQERRRGNCTERVVRATARSYVIGPAALGRLAADPDSIRDRWSWSYLVAVAARAIRELAVLRKRADRAGKKLATLTLDTEIRFADAEAQRAFARDLGDAVTRLVTRYHDESSRNGRRYRLVATSYPTITKREDEETRR